MKSLYLNENDDLDFDNMGNLKMVNGNDEVRQRIEISLNINEGEWIFDKTLGIPWIDLISDKDTKIYEIENEIIDEVESDDRVEEVIEIESDLDTARRDLDVKFKAKLTNGDIVSGEVEV